MYLAFNQHQAAALETLSFHQSIDSEELNDREGSIQQPVKLIPTRFFSSIMAIISPDQSHLKKS